MKSNDTVRADVRKQYAAIARAGRSCCDTSCCSEPSLADMGYRTDEIAGLPDGMLAGLGCGSPVGLAALASGETVVDLGSGGGLDALLASRAVGPSGRVIGVDMTPEMLERARTAAAKAGLRNVEFRQGLIEALPIADASVDAIVSNCVVNLAPDKAAVFRDAFRVLKPGGRLIVSDIVARGELPPEIRNDAAQWASCVGGAIDESEYLDAIRAAGFSEVNVLEDRGPAEGPVHSITVRADKA